MDSLCFAVPIRGRGLGVQGILGVIYWSYIGYRLVLYRSYIGIMENIMVNYPTVLDSDIGGYLPQTNMEPHRPHHLSYNLNS